jgi:hypothetical protein
MHLFGQWLTGISVITMAKEADQGIPWIGKTLLKGARKLSTGTRLNTGSA